MRLNLGLGALAALQLLVGLIGQLAVLRIVRVGPSTDAYIAAQTIPLIVSVIITSSLQSLWLPRFARAADAPALRAENGVAQGQTLKLLLAVLLPLGMSSPLWVALVYPGFSEDQAIQVVALGVPLFCAALITGMSGLLTTALRSGGRFLTGEIVGLSAAVFGLGLVLFLVPRHGVVAAAWIALIRSATVYVTLLTLSGWPWPVLAATDAGRAVWAQLRPLLGGAMLIKASPLVDRYWGSQAPGGGVTTLNIAQLTINSLATVLERAILVPVLPEFARRLARADLAGLKRAYSRCLVQIGGVTLAVAIALLVLRPVWDEVLFMALRASPQTSEQIWAACFLLLPYLFVSVGGSAAVAVFYAFGETRLPISIGVLGFLASLFIKGALFSYFGILGLAGGASLYLLLNMALYHIAVERRIGRAVVEAGSTPK